MTRNARYTLAVWAVALMFAAPLRAQERLGTGAPDQTYHAGWTFTPTFGFAETYDDNISLFGVRTAEQQNNDYIATYFPEADLHYVGHHTTFGADYTGSFLDYRTFSTLNRWDQRGRLEFSREESPRLKWFAHGDGALLPSTDLIELGGIPFRETGVTTLDGRAGVEYLLDAKNQISSSAQYQDISFDRTGELSADLRGGHVFESLTAYRVRLAERLSTGADYSYRLASVVGDTVSFNIHTAMAAADYRLSPTWTFSGGAGVVYLQETAETAAHSGPAWRASLDRHVAGASFHVGYIRSYIPSFGFGGTIQNQEVGVGFRLPLFASPRFYTEQSAVFRDDTPLTSTVEQLPLRSLQTYSIFGWEADRWLRLEVYYARVDQTSLQFGGELYRNRVGFQIVTSKPMRIQ